jgi:pimeloyl-ACP methyl ester carboxylesterase
LRPPLIRQAFGDYQLDGQLLRSPGGDACRMLAIHGARSNRTILKPLLRPLQKLGIGSLSFDLSGHTKRSPIQINQTSLAQNLFEARQFAQSLGSGLDTVFGHSLGGALAMKIAEHFQDSVRTLILSCPALYPEAAYEAECYGSKFTEVISQPFGFLDSPSLPFLRSFEGNVILIVGEYDGLRAEYHGGTPGRSAGVVQLEKYRFVYSPIPTDVFAAIQDAAGSRLTKIQLDDCDHQVFSHLVRHKEVAETLSAYLCRKILSLGMSSETFQISSNGHLIGANAPLNAPMSNCQKSRAEE